MDLQEYESKLGEVFEFRKTLTPETDRGCALMAAAYLDSQLEDLLMLHFVDDPAVVEELLGQSKPLGSFSSRIDMAYVSDHAKLITYSVPKPSSTFVR